MTIQDLGDVQERDGKFMVLVHVNPDQWQDTAWTREQFEHYQALAKANK